MKAKNKRGSDVENKDMSIELPSLYFINLLTPLHRNKEIILGLAKSCTKLLQREHREMMGRYGFSGVISGERRTGPCGTHCSQW